jgi:hypothetical protein
LKHGLQVSKASSCRSHVTWVRGPCEKWMGSIRKILFEGELFLYNTRVVLHAFTCCHKLLPPWQDMKQPEMGCCLTSICCIFRHLQDRMRGHAYVCLVMIWIQFEEQTQNSWLHRGSYMIVHDKIRQGKPLCLLLWYTGASFVASSHASTTFSLYYQRVSY